MIWALTRWAIIPGYLVSWTGFGDFAKPDSNYIPEKTLWDWMQLLLIPVFLSIGVLILNRSEREHKHDIAVDRQQEIAFQAYLDRMTNLLLRNELRTSKKREEVRIVARIRTLSVLRGLDPQRKGMVLLFLEESRLIYKKEAIVELRDADLCSAKLSHAILKNTYLRDTNLNNIDLSYAKLNAADLSYSRLKNANLRSAELTSSDLIGTNLTSAHLVDAQLQGAKLNDAILKKAHLNNAILTGAILKGANLSGANLRGADFRHADLSDAIVSRKQLAQAKTENATLPEGI